MPGNKHESDPSHKSSDPEATTEINLSPRKTRSTMRQQAGEDDAPLISSSSSDVTPEQQFDQMTNILQLLTTSELNRQQEWKEQQERNDRNMQRTPKGMLDTRRNTTTYF